MSYSGKIEQLVEDLGKSGWQCNLHNFKIPQFSMHVDYDSKKLTINCPKAYHAAVMLAHVADIVLVEREALSNQKCRAVGSYVYSYIGLEIFEYENPEDPDHKSFNNLVLTGMPLSMFTGEFMPEDNAVELAETQEQN